MDDRPVLLDLFCGAGGCAKGYQMAGFRVVGVDHVAQPRYVGDAFVKADAPAYVAAYGHLYDAIHASPPCQRWSLGTPDPSKHPDLIGPTRELLEQLGRPYVIENVPHAPVRPDVRLCGCQVGLPMIRRVRHFEVSFPIFDLLPPCHHNGPVITVAGNGTTSGNRRTWGRNISVKEMRRAMGIDWMPLTDLSQAIPPRYAEWIGRHLMQHLTGVPQP